MKLCLRLSRCAICALPLELPFICAFWLIMISPLT